MGVAVDILPAQPAHVAELAASMRPGDVAECLAAGYGSAREALEVSATNSEKVWAVTFDGAVAALVGVEGIGGGTALVWALTGTAVDKARLTFFRVSRWMLSELLGNFSRLVNLVDARYQGALDWLECLGFSVSPPAPHPTTGAPFCLVSIGRA